MARICRRICLLRERGQPAAAEELSQGELAAALDTVRATDESAAALEQKLGALFAAETERVANAVVLAELLAPLLAPKPGVPESPAESPHAFVAGVPLAASPPRGDPADLAHFIDEMIAQERTTPARRAS